MWSRHYLSFSTFRWQCQDKRRSCLCHRLVPSPVWPVIAKHEVPHIPPLAHIGQCTAPDCLHALLSVWPPVSLETKCLHSPPQVTVIQAPSALTSCFKSSFCLLDIRFFFFSLSHSLVLFPHSPHLSVSVPLSPPCPLPRVTRCTHSPRSNGLVLLLLCLSRCLSLFLFLHSCIE